eukprot:930915-Amphidinium_carterae.1
MSPTQLMTPTAGTQSQTPQATPRDDMEVDEGLQTVGPSVADCSCPADGGSSTRHEGASRHALQPVDGHPEQFVAEVGVSHIGHEWKGPSEARASA